MNEIQLMSGRGRREGDGNDIKTKVNGFSVLHNNLRDEDGSEIFAVKQAERERFEWRSWKIICMLVCLLYCYFGYFVKDIFLLLFAIHSTLFHLSQKQKKRASAEEDGKFVRKFREFFFFPFFLLSVFNLQSWKKKTVRGNDKKEKKCVGNPKNSQSLYGGYPFSCKIHSHDPLLLKNSTSEII